MCTWTGARTHWAGRDKPRQTCLQDAVLLLRFKEKIVPLLLERIVVAHVCLRTHHSGVIAPAALIRLPSYNHGVCDTVQFRGFIGPNLTRHLLVSGQPRRNVIFVKTAAAALILRVWIPVEIFYILLRLWQKHVWTGVWTAVRLFLSANFRRWSVPPALRLSLCASRDQAVWIFFYAGVTGAKGCPAHSRPYMGRMGGFIGNDWKACPGTFSSVGRSSQ